jgi:hypothetical protein
MLPGHSGDPAGHAAQTCRRVREDGPKAFIPHDEGGEKLRVKFSPSRIAQWKHAIATSMVPRVVVSSDAVTRVR